LLAGSGQLFNSLMKENLIDLYRFMVHPVVLGHGRRLMTDESARRELDLKDVKRFSTGIVVLELAPA
jgi:dihydrofolate reductase